MVRSCDKACVGILALLSSVLVTSQLATASDGEDVVVSLFNGRNLEGWKSEGKAHWEVQDGLLIGRQGENNSPGDLLTEAAYANFDLIVEFRVTWPANSGVWYRYQSADQSYQADILEYKNPVAWTGTLYCTGKMFIAINKDPELVHRDSWNTLRIRADGNHHVVWLNGTEVANVRDDTSARGRIGFQIHAGDEFAKMQIAVKKVELRAL
ncbi:MAG: DUF1080 domain-containing protein [Planctomycetales bacterium]|nr:DUF1080 domain-containing protein [Planctomycetales bacterium]